MENHVKVNPNSDEAKLKLAIMLVISKDWNKVFIKDIGD